MKPALYQNLNDIFTWVVIDLENIIDVQGTIK